MPDTRKHRGTHPEDERLFATDARRSLRRATSDLSWLLGRGYTTPSALKLVGDRYNLTKRQRTAVGRCACSPEAVASRQSRRIVPQHVGEQEVWVDGYNVLTTLEAALAGGIILAACDGCYRDMASMHGSYRKVSETLPALELLGDLTAGWNVRTMRWFLDSPVSNSGRLKLILKRLAERAGWDWQVELVSNPDTVLSETSHIVATADSVILDRCRCWLNLARLAVEDRVPNANVVDLSAAADGDET